MRIRTKVFSLVWGVALAASLGVASSTAKAETGASPSASTSVRTTARHARRTTMRRAHVHGATARKTAAKPANGDAAVRKPKPRSSRPQHERGVTMHAGRRVARPAEPPSRPDQPCLRPPVAFERGFGGAVESIALTRCDGRPAPLATLELSIVARPESAPKPAGPVIAAALAHRTDPGPDVKLVGEGLVTRLQTVADHFHAAKVIIVSGYRPNSTGSFHQMAEALDLHFDGIPNEALVAFCRTLPDTGCGYYPNSSFVHLDVRPAHTGHVYWIDASGPGEAARYVSTWPMIEHEPAPCAEGARRDAWCAHIVRPDQLVAEPALAIVPDSAGDPFTP